jgi:glutamine cyclotransferase
LTARRSLSLALLLGILCSCTACPQQEQPTAYRYGYNIVASYHHDPGAYTQGLVYDSGYLYESTGMYLESSIRRVDLETGEVLASQPLPHPPSDSAYFGEGLALHDGKFYQLTWKHNTGFVYDQQTFESLGTFSYATDGWGLAFDGNHFILSDGSAWLRFFDPKLGFDQAVRAVKVQDADGPVEKLNELEYINGEVYANVYHTDYIVRVNPETGEVVSWIDLSGLLAPEDRTGREDVLNGIAYDAENDRLFVTGKYWPKLFEIELVPVVP